jgi:hypothetical protein
MALLILDHGTTHKWVVNFTPRATLPPGKNPGTLWTEGWVYPTAVLHGFREEKNFLHLPGIEPQTVQFVASRYTVYATKNLLSVQQLQPMKPQILRSAVK